jgi:ABC-2 type transport system ATP-binding protein
MSDDSRPPIIRVRGLTRRFGEFTAVDDLSISVPPGSIYAFLGANGSGKSTTIRMLIGLLLPTAGEIEVDGVDVCRHPRSVRDRIGYMGQRVSLYQGLTLRENVEFYGGLYDLEGAALLKRWQEVGERFDLTAAEGEKVEDLPAGIRQRAGLALATLHRPRVLFLDEPTAGVDVRNRSLFWEIIQGEAAAGVTVFVTTHFLEEAEYCDWVSFIDRGRLIADDAPENLRARFAGGYRIHVEVPTAAHAEAICKLAAAGIEASSLLGEIVFTTPTLGPRTLGAIEELVKPAGRTIRVEQPEMTEVFRQVLAGTGVAA